jgi:hypothetical protein
MTSATKRRPRSVAGALALAALGLVIWAVHLHRSVGPAEEAPAPPKAAPTASAAVAPEATPVPPPVEPAAACATPQASVGAPAHRSPEREYAPPAVEHLEWMGERALLKARWAAESGDSAWTERAASLITQILLQANLGTSALRNVDCRQTVCQLKLHSDSKQHRDVSNLIAASRKVIEQTFLVPIAAESGGWDIEAYFPKEGYSLEGGHVGAAREVTESGS